VTLLNPGVVSEMNCLARRLEVLSDCAAISLRHTTGPHHIQKAPYSQYPVGTMLACPEMFLDSGGGNGIVKATGKEDFEFVCGNVAHLSMAFLPQVLQILTRPLGAVVAPQQVFFDHKQFQAGHRIQLAAGKVSIGDVVQFAHKIGTAPKSIQGRSPLTGSYVPNLRQGA